MALHKTLHVLPADERNVLAETCPMKVDQPVPVAVLLGPHLLEQF